jgi:uncharacterized protein with FMN-binding domain
VVTSRNPNVQGTVRRIVIAIGLTITGLVMLFNYPSSTAGAGAPTQARDATLPSPIGAGTVAPSGAGTFTGDTVDTRWGPVQVAITVSGGRITNATAVVYPNGNSRDQQINAYALPVLAQEVVAAQSAHIDHVSGATVTSGGYIGSVQSAIDQANL